MTETTSISQADAASEQKHDISFTVRFDEAWLNSRTEEIIDPGLLGYRSG
jgi:hypothetical protein